MAGPKAAGTVTGAGVVGAAPGGQWTPTVKFLAGLVVGELILYGLLRHYTSHGG